MKHETIYSWAGSILASVASVNAELTGERLVAIITGVIAIISGLASLAYTIWKWYKVATSENSKGGKEITVDEFGELIELLPKKGDDTNDRNQ